MNKLKLIWTDQNGKLQTREFDTEPEARKARDWLREKGADDVDMAVIIVSEAQEDVPNPFPIN